LSIKSGFATDDVRHWLGRV